MSIAVTCSNCGTLIAVQVEYVTGTVLYDRTDGVDREERRYPVTIPPNWGTPGYLITVCMECSTRLVVETELRQSPVVVWPLADTQVSEDVPKSVRFAVVDAKRAAAANSITGAVMSARTAIERIQREQKVTSLSELWKTKQLAPNLFDAANEPRLWGHVVAHDDFDPEEIESKHVGELLTFVDILLDSLYRTPARLERARKVREALEGPGQ